MDSVATMNFDGLVGPNHNYAGLSHGNVASATNAHQTSRPREAVLQGLTKMAKLSALGVPQGVLPPLERPRLDVLRGLGFAGDDAAILQAASKSAPTLFHAIWSASAMWTANAATVTASADASDGRVHFTPANLSSKFHRSLEANETQHALQRIFAAPNFAVHDPLIGAFADEGAANHTRLAAEAEGIDFFVWGRSAFGSSPTKVYPARQTREASEAIARVHGVRRPVFAQQSPAAIDAGAFHNDVVSVGHGERLLAHGEAFSDPEGVKQALNTLLPSLRFDYVPSAELGLGDAVSSYLFNSQLVRDAAGAYVLVAPQEARENERARLVTERWLAEGTVDAVHFMDLRQSMRNGGGPACLRLRVPLTTTERTALHRGVVFDGALHDALRVWAERHYREELRVADLADPKLLVEVREALDALTQLLGLGGDFYRFQRV